MPITHDEGPVEQRTLRGPSLWFRATWPEGTPRAVVALLHGYGDHVGRYAHVMDVWAQAGIATVGIDMRGHGRAQGPRGYCAHFEEFLDDAAELVVLVEKRAPGLPAFLFGHSFGGLVAVCSVLESPRSWRGLLLTGAYFDLALAVPAPKVLLGRVASRLAPRLAMPAGLSGSMVTRDAARAAAYDGDPLAHKVATARWFTETKKAQARALAQASQLRLPLHMVYGAADPIAHVGRGREFFDKTGSRDKSWDARPDLRHEPLTEPEGIEIAGGMAQWMLQRAS